MVPLECQQNEPSRIEPLSAEVTESMKSLMDCVNATALDLTWKTSAFADLKKQVAPALVDICKSK